MHLGRVELIIPGLNATDEHSNCRINELSKQVFSFVLEIDVVFEFLRDSVLDLHVQLWDSLEAILARIDEVYTAQLLLIVEQDDPLGVLIECSGRQLRLELPDVVFEDSLERALQIEQGTAAAELKAAVKRLFDVLEEVKRRAENNEVNCF